MTQALVKDPVYQQLNQILRDLVRKGGFREGQQFLTEREVCDRFAVSRATANKALSSLVSEGILEFRKGVGTFVRAGVLDYDTRSLVSFNDKAVAAGKAPTTRVLRFDRVPGSQLDVSSRAALGLGDSEEAFVVERLRLADGVPVIFERRAIPCSACPSLSADDVAGSLYAAWTARHSLDIAGAEQTIRAVNLGESDARRLGVVAGSAALRVSSIGRLRDGKPLWHEQTLYRSDMYEFHASLGGIRPGGAPGGQFMGTPARHTP